MKLRAYRAIQICLLLLFFKPTGTKPQTGKLDYTYNIMVATAIYSVTMVLWKETAFPLCILRIAPNASYCYRRCDPAWYVYYSRPLHKRHAEMPSGTDSPGPKEPCARWMYALAGEYDKTICAAGAMLAVATVTVATCSFRL